ncbi:MAG: diacylglycerol kinase family protein [Candidatus Sulfotelmatobacter sp.]
MRKAALVHNPDSGGSQRRRRELESVLVLLRNRGVEAEIISAESQVAAGEAVKRAIDGGCDTIFACGGDGTIHNIAQVLANTPVALAALPMGTANALVHDLGLPRSVIGAAEAALTGILRRVALGRAEYRDLQGNQSARYFVIAAGMGVDAHLIYKLRNSTKQRMGMAAYYAEAWHLWFSYPMTRFVAEYVESGRNDNDNDHDKDVQRAEVTELMSIRIRNFGGVVQELAPGASLDRNDMRLVFSRTASRLSYLAYVTRGLLRQSWKVPGIDLVHSTKVTCRYCEPAPGEKNQRTIYLEADGELLGTLPAELTVVPDALTLLAPTRSHSSKVNRRD